MTTKTRILVVGAGFAGAVIARELADTNLYHVTVIDKRDHIAGNTYDPICPETGNRYHMYGPHIFHTNSKDIVDYLSRFTQWLPYEHQVKALVTGTGQVPLPINIDTLNLIYNEQLKTEADVNAFLDKVRIPIEKPANALEHLYSIYGKELTEQFFARYTQKMWDLGLEQMPVSVVARIPVRYDNNPNYFNDKYQMMPKNGYLELFKNMLTHENIEVKLSTAFNKMMEQDYSHCFNSMPIDEYFDFQFGELPYRSIKFEHSTDAPFEFHSPTVNYTDTGKYTRITDWQLYPGAGGGHTPKITREIPCSYKDNNLERYYPVKTIDGKPQVVYTKYRELSQKLSNKTFIGRCGQYIYYDIHQVVANSLTISKAFLT